VVFNVEDRILVVNLYKFKDYSAKIVNFLTKVELLIVWTIGKKLRDTGNAARQPGSGRCRGV